MFKRLPVIGRFCSYTCAYYQPPAIFAERDNFQPQILKRGWNQKIRVPGGGGLKEFLSHIFAQGGEGEVTMFFVKKYFRNKIWL